jgi:polar amino acid transport system substrate-binding protein
MKRFIMSVIVVFFLSAGICYGGNKHVTSAANSWSPFVDPDAAGQGLSIEIIKAAFAAQGYTFEHKFMPWARAEDEVKKGKSDILPDTWYTDERSKYLMFSNAYASNKIKFIKKGGDPFEYEGIASLAGKKVGVIIGFGYGDEFMNAKTFTREGVSDFITNIKKLVRGRVDLTIEDEIVAKSILNKKAPALLEQVEFIQNPLSSNDLYVACGLANPRHEEIINAFNKGLEAIKADGTLKGIFERYGIH